MNDGIAHTLFGGIRQNRISVNKHDQLDDAEDEQKDEENSQDEFNLGLPVLTPVE